MNDEATDRRPERGAMPTQTMPPRARGGEPGRLPATTPRPRVRRRERLRGAAATLLLLAIVAGVPYGLVVGVGEPIHHAPTKDWLTQPLDGYAIVHVLAIAVWIVWAHFTVCVIAEWRAETHGAPTRPRIPLGGLSQMSARKLVATALLLVGIATMGAGPAASGFHSHSTPIAATAVAPAHAAGAAMSLPGGGTVSLTPQADTATAGIAGASRGAGAVDVSKAGASASTKVYEVKAPTGRNYDTLWGIAERYLGDGRRYKEIFAENQGRLQPDGARLTKPDLIRPGWILRMPADAEGPGLRTVDPLPVSPAPDAATATTTTATTTTATTTTATTATTAAAAAAPSATPSVPSPSTATAAAPSAGDAIAGPSASRAVPSLPTHARSHTASGPASSKPVAGAAHTDSVLATSLGRELVGGSLIAAGLLLALGRRGTGAPTPGPYDPDGETEAKLRLAADTPSADFLDAVLRSLSNELREQARTLPDVYAAILDDEALLLRSVTAQDAPPAPWTADDKRTWRLLRKHADKLRLSPKTLAPYPTLAVIGRVGDSRVLLDIEAAGGVIALGGDGRVARDIAAHIAVELATNPWSDDIVVTMVGFGDELSALAPGRLLHEVALPQALENAEQRLAHHGSAFTDDIGSVLRGRQLVRDRSRYQPHIVVLSAPPSVEDAARLGALAADPRAPLGVIVVGDVREARWRFIAEANGTLELPALGLQVQASALPPEQYRAVIGLFSTPAADFGLGTLAHRHIGGGSVIGAANGPDGGGSAPHIAFRRDELLDESRNWPVEVRILGPAQVSAPGGLERSRRDLATEIVVFLALRPDGAHPNVLQAALWPRGVEAAVMSAALAHAQSWLGQAGDGLPRLRQDEHGRWRLADGVRFDWDVARTRLAHAVEGSPNEESQLAATLALVRGPAWDCPPAGAYAWLAREAARGDVPATIIAAAHRAAGLALARGDAATSVAHARAGLLMTPGAEALWRDVLHATARLGRPDLAAAAQEWWATMARLRTRDATAAQTDALVAELLPGFKPAA